MARGRFIRTHFARDYDKLVVAKKACRIEEPGAWIPLLRVTNFSSSGLRTMLWSHTNQRPVDVMSQAEADHLSLFDVDEGVGAIMEQAACDPERTLRIAEQERIAHPSFEGQPTIMSTDFVVLRRTSSVGNYHAYSIKRSEDITPRVIEKSMIEKLYWAERDIPFSVVLDTDIKEPMRTNLRALSPRRDPDKVPATSEEIDLVARFCSPHVEAGVLPMAALGRLCDAALALERGTSLAVLWHLAAVRRWPVDVAQAIRGDLPLPLCAHHLN